MPLLSTSQFSLSFHAIFPTYAKRPLPSLHLKVVHTHWLKLFNFQLFCIVSFYKSLHYAPYFLQTLHNFCIISKLKSLQSPINTSFIYPSSSSSGLGFMPLNKCLYLLISPLIQDSKQFVFHVTPYKFLYLCRKMS